MAAPVETVPPATPAAPGDPGTPPAPDSPEPAATPRAGGRRPARIPRLGIGLNVALQIALAAFFVGMVNYFGSKYHHTFDLSRDRRYTLSARTRQFLDGLTRPVRLIVFMPDTSTLRSDVSDLLHEYRDAQPRFVQLEDVSPYRNLARASELQGKYKLGAQDSVVIVESEGRHKVVSEEDLAEVDRSGEQFGQAPTVTAFRGEQMVTSAILEMVEGKKNLVYSLRGHAEPELGPNGVLALFQQYVERDNLQLKELNLLNVGRVPADANAVLLAGAKYDLSEAEIKALDEFWNQQGRFFVILNPDAPTPRLAAFLDRLGIKVDDDRITKILSLGLTSAGAQLVMRSPQVAAEVALPAGPVTQRFQGVNFQFPGSTQSLTLEPDRVSAGNVRLEPLLRAQKGFWGEVDYRDPEEAGARLDPGRDKETNLVLAAAAERGALGDPRVQVGTARLVVFANARFVENEQLSQDNLDFVLASVNWLLDRKQLIGIPPREVRTFNVSLRPGQIELLTFLTTLAIPGFAALVGLLVWLRRRG